MTTAPKDATKDGKLDASLLPMDLLIKYVVPAYQEGVIKYERESWRRGFPVTDLIAALRRHESAFSSGEDLDPEALEKFGIEKHHLGAVIFCCLALLHTLDYHNELDNRRDPKTGDLINDTTRTSR